MKGKVLAKDVLTGASGTGIGCAFSTKSKGMMVATVGSALRRLRMPKVRCASTDCKYHSDTNICKYKGTLILNDCYYHTVNEGFQHFHRCKMYEKSEEVEKFEKDFVTFMEERGLG